MNTDMSSANSSDVDDERDDDDANAPDNIKSSNPPSSSMSIGEVAYNNLLQFLQLGCNGCPVKGYPLIIIILSTIPSTVGTFR